MARQITDISTQVGELPVQVQVVEFPTIEDVYKQLIIESAFARKVAQVLSETSPVPRDIKDFLIKNTVAGT